MVPLDRDDFRRAEVFAADGINDYEDAVQMAAAVRVGASFLVTRNTKDFPLVMHWRGRMLKVNTPSEVLAALAQRGAEK